MPNAAKRICSLHRLIHDGKCPKCKASGPQQHKGTSKNRSGDPFCNTTQWKAIRDARRRANPLCQECEKHGVTKAMHAVDHILPRATHPELELDFDNTQSLCERCHNRKTGRETIGKMR